MIDGERRLEAIRGRLAPEAEPSRVADQHIEPIDRLIDPPGEGLNCPRRREVSLDQLQVGAGNARYDLLPRCLSSPGIPTHHQDARAPGRQSGGSLQPYTGVGSGDQAGLTAHLPVDVAYSTRA